MLSHKTDAHLNPRFLVEYGSLLLRVVSYLVLPPLLFFIFLAGYSNLSGIMKIRQSNDDLITIPEATVQAYRIGAPVRKQMQAVVAAQSWLQDYPSFRSISLIGVLSAKQMKYGEAQKRTAEPGDDPYFSLSPVADVWLVVFEGEFQVVMGESSGLPDPAGSGCVSVVVNPEDGSLLGVSGVGECSQ